MSLVSANVSPAQPLTTGTPIELGFDRLLLPSAVTRQTFVLQDLQGDYLEPSPAYDPVSRVVRLCVAPPTDQTYRLTIVSPQSAEDPNGLRAIDGADLSLDASMLIEFPVVAGPAYEGTDRCPPEPGSLDAGGAPGNAASEAGRDAGSGRGIDAATDGPSEMGEGGGQEAGTDATLAASPPPPVDFCSQVLPIFASKCGGSSCHSGLLPAAGLQMTSAQGIEATAIGRVAQGSNTGTRAAVTAPNAGGLFTVDMAIIAPGDPAESWLLYKLLMADPPPCSSTPGAPACDASVPAVHDNLWNVPWTPLSNTERATLSNFIPGREMPYPNDPSAPLEGATAPLTVDELDLVSLWIFQGASVQACAQ